jgi:hypothetical protein
LSTWMILILVCRGQETAWNVSSCFIHTSTWRKLHANWLKVTTQHWTHFHRNNMMECPVHLLRYLAPHDIPGEPSAGVWTWGRRVMMLTEVGSLLREGVAIVVHMLMALRTS